MHPNYVLAVVAIQFAQFIWVKEANLTCKTKNF